MEKKLGIYIHIPFCASKCGYCDFYSFAGHDEWMNRYQDALLKHIAESAEQMAPYYVDTVYFGGGTPSYYGAKRVSALFNALKRCAKVLKTAEVTVEMNPDSVKRHELALLRAEGVNRISLGVQSANDEILRLIGRRHNFKQAEKAVDGIRREGFRNLSIDLIYGLPSQGKNDWAATLTRAIALRPEHFSCYGLKLEESVPLYASYHGSPLLPSDDDQADMYLYTVEELQNYGYRQYEISNFARRGKESKHNIKYWDLDDYMGFGAGAHSFVNGTRYSFVADAKRYISGVLDGELDIIDEYEKVDNLGLAAEYLMLGLRRSKGISREEYRSVYRSDFDKIEEMLKEFERKAWAVYESGRWRFTSAGLLLSNILIGALLEVQAENKLIGNPWVRESIEEATIYS